MALCKGYHDTRGGCKSLIQLVVMERELGHLLTTCTQPPSGEN